MRITIPFLVSMVLLSLDGCFGSENVIDLGFDSGGDGGMGPAGHDGSTGPDADSDADVDSDTDVDADADADIDADIDADADADTDADGDADAGAGDCGTGYWGVGEPCQIASQCNDLDPQKRWCIPGNVVIGGIEFLMPGGYCTVFACTDDCYCGEGALCAQAPGILSFCLKRCADNSECREPDYQCVELADYTLGLLSGRVCLAPLF